MTNDEMNLRERIAETIYVSDSDMEKLVLLVVSAMDKAFDMAALEVKKHRLCFHGTRGELIGKILALKTSEGEVKGK